MGVDDALSGYTIQYERMLVRASFFFNGLV